MYYIYIYICIYIYIYTSNTRIIIEQSMECDSSVYINFVDYEKAYDSPNRDTLWNLLQHYGIPDTFISLIRNTSVTILIPARHGLDHENDYGKQKK